MSYVDDYDGPVSDAGLILIGHGYFGCDSGGCGLEAVFRKRGDRHGGRVLFRFTHDAVEFAHMVTRSYPGVPQLVVCWTCEDGSAHDDAEEGEVNETDQRPLGERIVERLLPDVPPGTGITFTDTPDSPQALAGDDRMG